MVHHRLKQGRETREKGGYSLGDCLDKMANRPDAMKFGGIVCGDTVLCDIECSLHTLSATKQRTSGETGYSFSPTLNYPILISQEPMNSSKYQVSHCWNPSEGRTSIS
jgi:hypothetical protein